MKTLKIKSDLSPGSALTYLAITTYRFSDLLVKFSFGVNIHLFNFLSVLHLLPRSFPASADTDLYIKLTLHEGGRVIKVGSAAVQCLQSSRTLFSST